MINPKRWYIVVTKNATLRSGIPMRDTKHRLMHSACTSAPAPDFRPGQRTTIEDDGFVRWTVTRTGDRSPSGNLGIAIVVDAERYKPEPTAIRS